MTQRFEWIYTPKHASWLNIAEMEWAVLQRQCLGQRLATMERVTAALQAWATDRNQRSVKVSWQFTTSTARETLSRHYPQSP